MAQETPSGIEGILTQEHFNKMFCLNCGKKPEEHTLVLSNRCHKNDAVKVTYSAGRLYIDCHHCGKGIAIVQVAKA